MAGRPIPLHTLQLVMTDTIQTGESPPSSRARGARGGTWKVVAVTALVTTALLATAAYFSIRWEPVREAVDAAVSPGRPLTSTGNRGLRSILLGRRDNAVARGDLAAAAELNADLAHEALVRVYVLHRRSLGR